MTLSQAEWVDCNRMSLVASFERLKRRLARKEGAAHAEISAEPESGDMEYALSDRPSAIDALAEVFGLTSFERSVLLLCAGVEMDSELAALCAQGQGTRGSFATFGLALGVLPEAHWSALTSARPLRRFRLIEVDPTHALTSAPLRIDERILHYLAGVNTLDPRLEARMRRLGYPQWAAPEHAEIARRIADVFDTYRNESPVIHLCGGDAQGQEDAAALAFHQTGWDVYALKVEDLPSAAGPDPDQIHMLWRRESLLLNAGLLIECGSAGLNASARYLVERLRGRVAVSSREPIQLTRSLLRFDVEKPQPSGQKRLWERALEARAAGCEEMLDGLAEQFRLSAKTIYETGALTAGDGSPIHPNDLWNVCRASSRPLLDDLAQRLTPAAGWNDLVLPDAQIQTLRQLATQVRHRMQVYDDWGFCADGSKARGVSALFTGDSGVGKTLAAEVLAADLSLDLYRVDVSAVVSKYIGETSKNMKQVFDAAEESGVLLLFDEADALFGKRGDVKDSRDRYANIDVSYLLQRMDSYRGLAILTTNLKTSVDRAFQRRLRFTINFPFPDFSQREAIWTRIFPPKTPTEGLDMKKLAQLNVSGGNIRNIAVNAAFLAAESKQPVRMDHLLQAARLEAHKIERPFSDAETRGWI